MSTLGRLRRSQGVTQEQIAHEMGVSRQWVVALEGQMLSNVELGAIAGYVEALGFELRVTVGLPEGDVVLWGPGDKAAGRLGDRPAPTDVLIVDVRLAEDGPL